MASADDPVLHARAQQREALEQLGRVHGERELHAAVLALLLPPGNERALQAWRVEAAAPNADALREQVLRLTGAARLPCFEQLVSRMALHPVAARQALLGATRRVIAATGTTRPIDRLHWLAMRRRLGETAYFGGRAAAHADLSQLPDSDVDAIARYSAFLSRMVPGDAATAGDGPAWYARAMAAWPERAALAPRQPLDADALVHALQVLQGFAWMLRPVLLRTWVGAALAHRPGARLADAAADALRLSGALLDSPLPPELARHYIAGLPEKP